MLQEVSLSEGNWREEKQQHEAGKPDYQSYDPGPISSIINIIYVKGLAGAGDPLHQPRQFSRRHLPYDSPARRVSLIPIVHRSHRSSWLSHPALVAPLVVTLDSSLYETEAARPTHPITLAVRRLPPPPEGRAAPARPLGTSGIALCKPGAKAGAGDLPRPPALVHARQCLIPRARAAHRLPYLPRRASGMLSASVTATHLRPALTAWRPS